MYNLGVKSYNSNAAKPSAAGLFASEAWQWQLLTWAGFCEWSSSSQRITSYRDTEEKMAMLQREAQCRRNHKHWWPQPQLCLLLINQCENPAILNLWHLYWKGVLWPVTQHNSMRDSENANRKVKIKMPGAAWQQWWACFCSLDYPVPTLLQHLHPQGHFIKGPGWGSPLGKKAKGITDRDAFTQSYFSCCTWKNVASNWTHTYTSCQQRDHVFLYFWLPSKEQTPSLYIPALSFSAIWSFCRFVV